MTYLLHEQTTSDTVYNIIAAGCRGLLDHIDGRDSDGR